MPTYEWVCLMGHRWEVSVPMTERDEPQVCPECEKAGVRAFTAPALPWTPAAGEAGRRNHRERLRRDL